MPGQRAIIKAHDYYSINVLWSQGGVPLETRGVPASGLLPKPEKMGLGYSKSRLTEPEGHIIANPGPFQG